MALAGSLENTSAGDPATKEFAGTPPATPCATFKARSAPIFAFPADRKYLSFQFFPIIFSSNHWATDPLKHDLRMPTALSLPVGGPPPAFGSTPIALRYPI